ncbi:hypothetical protein HBN50_03230 [Halobacteriovorax sp. GB3]|uniref:hypothetical protein n=1 Tax=Halobacteriovorax sp. GB3 TaxID=2719615 RepID=UPI002360DA49|nr:hypothetical protein [Halobacteriovorax sp. GB3]MDD0852089.1 hypothetical protein [Halobacteriovorax sp. GB3]
MKRIALLAFGLLIIALGYYVYSQDGSVTVVKRDDPKVKKDFTYNKEKILSEDAVEALAKKAQESEESPLSDEELEEMEEHFMEVEGRWRAEIEQLFIKELELSEEFVADYYKMREGFEKDSYLAFETYHEQMRLKHGDNYSYNPTEDEEAFQKEIRETYEKKLLEKMGKEKFRKYIQVKDRFNEGLIEGNDRKAALLIEF